MFDFLGGHFENCATGGRRDFQRKKRERLSAFLAKSESKYVQSLQRLYASCETAASRTENSVSFYPQRLEGQGPGRPALNIMKEQIEYLRSIHFTWEKNSPIACHKGIYASAKTKGA